MRIGELDPITKAIQAIERIERKLDTLIASLADDDAPGRTLDGDDMGRERDETQPL